MKNLIILIICVPLMAMLSSCEKMMGNYLDKAPGVDVTEDTIFSSKVQVETFVTATYRYGMHSILPCQDYTYTGGAYSTTSVATDESEDTQTWVGLQTWNNASVTAANILAMEGDPRWSIRFIAIRKTNILLQRIDGVKNLDPAYIQQVKGEARFIRALNYFEMLKRYGGVPVVDKKFELTDNFYVKRNTVEEVVNFILSDCDSAAALLSNAYSSDMTGRATKGAAMMLKAKTLLYAASPLFNTANPYLTMSAPANNKLICYGNYNINRWQLAADAAKAVIDWAPAGNINLITNQGIDNNYSYIFEKNDNPEIILANKSRGSIAMWDWPWCGLMPDGFGWGWRVSYSMTANFLKRYEKTDGTAQNWSQTGGNDLISKYGELDRRFKQSVGITGSFWNSDFPMLNSYDGGDLNSGNLGGELIMKFIPHTINYSTFDAVPNDVLFRLGEAYLNYAESLNEAQGPVVQAYAAINTIRSRSGQPDLPSGLSQSQFRDRVRNERAIELFDEDHRLWDIRRWLIAEQDGVMQGDFFGFKIYQNPAPPNFRYEVYKMETRSFKKAMYLHPFPLSEMLKGYLTQNPGY